MKKLKEGLLRDGSHNQNGAGITIMRKETKLALLFLLPALLIVWIQEIPPFIYALVYSLYHYNVAAQWTGIYFSGLENYRRLVFDPYVLIGFQKMFEFWAICIIEELIIGFVLALLLHRITRGKTIYRSVIIIPFAISSVVASYVWRLLLNPTFGVLTYYLNLIGVKLGDPFSNPSLAMLAVSLVNTWRWLPFMTLALLAGLEALPPEPYEAARTEGASALQRFRYITLPGLKNIIFILILIRTVWLFKEADVIHLITGGGPGLATQVIELRLYKIMFEQWDLGYACAITWIQFMISLAVVEVLSYYYSRMFRGRFE
ncbi:MAG: sugar ABC transporter permease [Candidatus Bathyarchaeia archaeon]